VPKDARITRDTFDVGPGQRVDLAMRTGNDGYFAAGPGVWLMHDHTQPAASNKGINPGGDHTVIVYRDFVGADGLPVDPLGGHSAHADYFKPEYYQGRIPVFDPTGHARTYEKGWPDAPPAGGPFDYPKRDVGGLPRLDLIEPSATARRRSCPSARAAPPHRGGPAGNMRAKAGVRFEPRELPRRTLQVEIIHRQQDEIPPT
jgi:hypothetical protein